MSRQQAFISTVRRALANPGPDDRRRRSIFAPVDAPGRRSVLDRIAGRTADQRMQLLDLLTRRADPLNLPVTAVEDSAAAAVAISKLVREKNPEWGEGKSVIAWQHPLIDRLNLADALAADHIPVHFPEASPAGDRASEATRARTIESFIGVTAADWCLAETATLAIRCAPGRPRATSLVPSIHVAVISLEQILADLCELYAVLQQDPIGPGNCMTLITGPSKTADIELNMVHGAHGPRELHLLVLTA